MSRAWVEVNLANLEANARRIQAANPNAKLLPMIKADAYGVGAVRAAQRLERLHPWGYGVATTREGIALRDAGVTRPIVVFTPPLANQLEIYRKHDLRPVLDDQSLINAWSGPFHLEIDTGMGRSGLPWRDAKAIAAALQRKPEGILTHFHSADVSESSVTEQQQRFHDVLTACGLDPNSLAPSGTGAVPLVHVANSAGSFRVSREGYALVRPGIFLYGGAVGVDQPTPEPVVALRARVVTMRSVEPGDSVSYGADWRPERPTRIATLAIGYGDGVRRSIQGRGCALVSGRRCAIVGRVTMDMTMVDVGPTGDLPVQRGDVATLMGSDGSTSITLDECATWAGTISYEILTGLSPRLPRIYSGA